jgi:hypothetical protein
MVGHIMGKDKPKVVLGDPRSEILKTWVSDFLWYWQDAGMPCHKAAEIIVGITLDQQAEGQNDLHRLPEPQSFFESQE